MFPKVSIREEQKKLENESDASETRTHLDLFLQNHHPRAAAAKNKTPAIAPPIAPPFTPPFPPPVEADEDCPTAIRVLVSDDELR